MVEPTKIKKRNLFDLSIMYSRECDLECPFCMYDSSPRIKDRLNLRNLEKFIGTFDSRINSIGLYGGEPAIHLEQYQKIVEMLPEELPRWIITNGTWSCNERKTDEFLKWIEKNNVSSVFVSGTNFHKQNQNRNKLKALEKTYNEIHLKGEEGKMYPMGRLKHLPFDCTQLCIRDIRPTRIAVLPNEDIIFQTCDGVYPVIGKMNEGFPEIVEKANRFWKNCEHF